jgi:hypothetical protein
MSRFLSNVKRRSRSSKCRYELKYKIYHILNILTNCHLICVYLKLYSVYLKIIYTVLWPCKTLDLIIWIIMLQWDVFKVECNCWWWVPRKACQWWASFIGNELQNEGNTRLCRAATSVPVCYEKYINIGGASLQLRIGQREFSLAGRLWVHIISFLTNFFPTNQIFLEIICEINHF